MSQSRMRSFFFVSVHTYIKNTAVHTFNTLSIKCKVNKLCKGRFVQPDDNIWGDVVVNGV